MITRPLRSALTIAPTELPLSVSTAPCLIGEHDRLRAPPDGRADVPRGIDAGDVRRAADVAHGAAKARLGRAEGEPVAERRRSPSGYALAVEERACPSRAEPPMTMPALTTLKLMLPLVGMGGEMRRRRRPGPARRSGVHEERMKCACVFAPEEL